MHDLQQFHCFIVVTLEEFKGRGQGPVYGALMLRCVSRIHGPLGPPSSPF